MRETPTKRQAEIQQTAQEKLGFESLRPGQQEAVESLLRGVDTMVVQPTGSGKSAIYQIAGLLIPGATLVVSPLIALQKDQVDAIADQSSAEAAAINSVQSATRSRQMLERLQAGEIEYLFLAPEQLAREETLEALREANISLFVVDEAHCVSEWGHDFRPDYLSLGKVIEQLGHPTVLALTATASEPVRAEIAERLGMRKPRVFVSGFDRPNIYMRVDAFGSETKKRDAVIHRARWADKPGIIYVSTRKAAEEIMHALEEEGVGTLHYHGGLNGKERTVIQDRFMADEIEVIVATNAFGMGVDKPNIRFVYHFQPPDSLDAYYQEIGRAGRDGNRSEAVLFYRREDVGAIGFRSGSGKPDPELLEKAALRLNEDETADAETLAEELGISKRRAVSVVQHLEDAGVEPQVASEHQELRGEAKRERLEKMRAYANASGCRREILLQYLGDNFQGPCGFCDNCEAATPADSSQNYSAGTRMEVR